MFSKNHPVILFLDRNGFSLFQDILSNILRFNFTPETVSSLDVISKEQLYNLILSFIETNKLFPSSLVVILSEDIVYEKDLQKQIVPAVKNATLVPQAPSHEVMINKEQQEKDIQNFLQNVPFEEILAKVIKVGVLTRLVVANKDLVSSVTESFRKKGFIIESVVPSFVYGQSLNLGGGLDKGKAQAILRKSDLSKLGNLLTDQQQLDVSPVHPQEEKDKEGKPTKIRQYILIGVFAVLLIVLGIVIFLSMNDSSNSKISPQKTPSNTISPKVSPKVTLSPEAPVGSASASLKIEDISIIISQEKVLPETNTLRTRLIRMGFKDVVLQVSKTSASAKSTVLFSKDIPTDIRQNTILEINKILENVLVLESESSDSKIMILVGEI